MIRIDDFPHGDKNSHLANPNLFRFASKIIDILESEKIDYIWGVSPLLCNEKEHIDALNKINHGKIVMHGFDHGFSKINDWSKCTEHWAYGGEFSFYSKSELLDKYIQCRSILSNFSSFDETHFIPPFNCFNQNILDVLNQHSNVEYIHTCDQEWIKYKQHSLLAGKIKPVVSELYWSYDHVHNVMNRLNDIKSIITLHWIYDIQHPDWINNYITFCRNFKSLGLK